MKNILDPMKVDFVRIEEQRSNKLLNHSKVLIYLFYLSAVHMRETRFKCDQCNFACMYKQGLESHIRSIHLKERENLCTMCPKRYFDKRDLIKHMENNHSITSNNKSKHHSPSKRSKREVIVD